MNNYEMHRVYNRRDTISFQDIDELYHHCQQEDCETWKSVSDLDGYEFVANESSLLFGRPGEKKELTNWSLSQLSADLGVPVRFVRELSQSTQEQVWNESLQIWKDNHETPQVSIIQNDDQILGVCGPTFGYEDHSVAIRGLRDFMRKYPEYKPYPTHDGRRSLFATDRSIHAFVGNGGSRLIDDGSPKGIHVGFMFHTSNVGFAPKTLSALAFREVCGNLIIWDVVFEVKVKYRHTKNLFKKTEQFEENFEMIGEFDWDRAQRSFDNARKIMIPGTVEKVIDWSRRFRGAKFTDAEIKAAYNKAEEEEGQVSTAYDLYNGATAIARDSKWPDGQVNLVRKWQPLLAEAVAA
jgi:hypothetical protein